MAKRSADAAGLDYDDSQQVDSPHHAMMQYVQQQQQQQQQQDQQPQMSTALHAAPEPPKAPQACSSCRRQKRKCDKVLPGCSLCVRMNRNCDYSVPTQQPSADDFYALRQKLADLESRMNDNGPSASNSPYVPSTSIPGPHGVQHHAQPPPIYVNHDPIYTNVINKFPAIAFLDSEAFKYGQIAVPRAAIETPGEVLELLGDGPSILAVISDFFTAVHSWMPIISKRRFTRDMVNPLWETGPDGALLFLCMKLMLTRTQEFESPINHIYLTAKRFLSLMENSGMASISVLQSYVLVTMYELAQAIYPGAWMTAGASVRYGQLLGIDEHPGGPVLLDRPQSWIEVEERKRTWWAVLILDRVVASGGQGRAFASEDPASDTDLPCDTNAWDEGDMVPSPTLGASSTYDEPRSPFARLCQASILLGKVVRHHYKPLAPDSSQYTAASELLGETLQLAQVLTKETEASDDYLLHTPALSVSYSALSGLCTRYACTQSLDHQSGVVDEAMKTESVDGIRLVTGYVKEMSIHLMKNTQDILGIDRCWPFTFDALYAAAANFGWLHRQEGESDQTGNIEHIKECLKRLGTRWRCASEYLRVLEAQEFFYAMGSVENAPFQETQAQNAQYLEAQAQDAAYKSEEIEETTYNNHEAQSMALAVQKELQEAAAQEVAQTQA